MPDHLHARGFAIVPHVLPREVCERIIEYYSDSTLFRSVIHMKRYRFGEGEYKYFSYPLPTEIVELRSKFYEALVPVANLWMKLLKQPEQFPESHEALLERCRQAQQVRPTPLILQYGKGGYNTLHQDLYGDVYFPFQVVIPLTQQGVDHEGGEFVLTEQLPRAQSRAHVLTPNQGDALIFTTNFRPVNGAKGIFKTRMKHGVSEIKSGERYALGIIFHDAT